MRASTILILLVVIVVSVFLGMQLSNAFDGYASSHLLLRIEKVDPWVDGGTGLFKVQTVRTLFHRPVGYGLYKIRESLFQSQGDWYQRGATILTVEPLSGEVMLGYERGAVGIGFLTVYSFVCTEPELATPEVMKKRTSGNWLLLPSGISWPGFAVIACE